MKIVMPMLLVSILRLTITLLAGGLLALSGCAIPPGTYTSADSGNGEWKTFGQ